jgi:geranylgeranyl transferase type-2 subunit alpha
MLLLQDIDLQLELNLTAACLERNPKSYGPWFHRKWCWTLYCGTNTVERDTFQKELQLCALFLLKDERNFHCWNYRRFIVGLILGGQMDGSWNTEDSDVIMGAQIVVHRKGLLPSTTTTTTLTPHERSTIIQAEWDYTSEKIQQNFSNFSAFDYRSKLFPLLLRKGNEEDFIKNELDLVHNAIFTEPDDQTAWWYHRFLVVLCGGISNDILVKEREILMELNEAEDFTLKWAWLGLHVVLTELSKQMNDDSSYEEEMNACLEQLLVLDPDRAARYVSMMKRS